MSNRYTIKGLDSFNKGLTYLEGEFAIGGSGAVSSYEGSGIGSITKTASAGSFQCTLEDGYKKLVGAQFTVLAASATAMPGIDEVVIIGDPDTTCNATTSPHFHFATLLNNALADGVSGAKIRFNLFFRNSSLKGKGE
jgi:hypothetical protein